MTSMSSSSRSLLRLTCSSSAPWTSPQPFVESPRSSATGSRSVTLDRSLPPRTFPFADDVVVDWPDRFLDKVGAGLSRRDSICRSDPRSEVRRACGHRRTGHEAGPSGDGIPPHDRGSKPSPRRRRSRTVRSRAGDGADRSGSRGADPGGNGHIDLRGDDRPASRRIAPSLRDAAGDIHRNLS